MEEKELLKESKSTKLKSLVMGILDNVKTYWKIPPKGNYMNFKEIFAYSFGGIGAYFVVSMSWVAILASTNTFITGAIGIRPKDMYIMYVIAVLLQIPSSGIRANIIDNTRSKEGKYRPYLLRMGLPSVLLICLMVWFPYDKLEIIFGTKEVFAGRSADYLAKCAFVLILNIVLQFFYYFFYDAYENLIHVMSPNTQERANVTSIKSVVYSLAPSILNLITPIIAQNIYHTNQNDIRVYRLLYPIISVLAMGLLILVYANTREKIIQARTHVIQIKFTDAIKAVAKNKYFWIIALAGWVAFLENSYANILYWLYNYGGACNGNQYAIITTIYGNSALWGMIICPFMIKKFGKCKTQIGTNILNIIFILMMIPFVMGSPGESGNLRGYTIWGILVILYINGIFNSFERILSPTIQADIRDNQQYISGERIDGAFATVGAIGNIVTLIASSVIPLIQERMGMTVENAMRVVNDPGLMSRILPGSKMTIGALLAEQASNGQDIYNAANALYDVSGTLLPLSRVFMAIAAVGALLNVIPFFFYDFTEEKQKSVVRVLKIRALFEDYSAGAIKDKDLVEAIDIVNAAIVTAEEEETSLDAAKSIKKAKLKSAKTRAEKKAAKKEFEAVRAHNEEIRISRFVVDELNKFETPVMKTKVNLYSIVLKQGLEGIKNTDIAKVKDDLRKAKKLSKKTKEQKEIRKNAIELNKRKLSSFKNYKKYYLGKNEEFVEPKMADLEKIFDREDEIDEELSALTKQISKLKKDDSEGAKEELSKLRQRVKDLDMERKALSKDEKLEKDKHAVFNRASEVYYQAKRLLDQKDAFAHFDQIAADYENAKQRNEEAERQYEKELAAQKAEQEAHKAQIKAEKEMKKKNKK